MGASPILIPANMNSLGDYRRCMLALAEGDICAITESFLVLHLTIFSPHFQLYHELLLPITKLLDSHGKVLKLLSRKSRSDSLRIDSDGQSFARRVALKGLFQRAIMEDGSALTPIVANHILSSPGLNDASIPRGPHHNSPAIQHVRFLAKLCDCPVYQKATKLSANGSQYNTVTSANEAQQQRQLSSMADEIKANSLTFECLRHKPIEQIMQPVPLDLLQFNQANGQLSIATHWLRLLSSLQVMASADSGSGQERVSLQSNEELAMVDARLLDKLAFAAIKEQIELDLMASEDMRMSELFGALYAPPSSNVRPIFGPIEDGTIVPEEDIATGMLKQGSTFAQRDLLIGLSQPVISSAASDFSSARVARDYSDRMLELGPEHLLADRITALMQREGLTNEQAVNLVDVFVHSFYRYHGQEITNSIINHYLSDSRVVKARKLSESFQSARGDKGKIVNADSKINLQQTFVLISLLEAFQDVMINIPVLKTGMIHSLKQLEPLVEVFIGQQFERRKQTVPQQPSGEHFETQIPVSEIQEAFTVFAQSLFNDTNWPLELHSQSEMSVTQPRATYLYQYDSFAYARRLEEMIEQLAAESATSSGWKSIKKSLEMILAKVREETVRRKMGFECIMQFNSDHIYSDDDISGQYLVEKFGELVCSRYANILKAFVTTGNVNNYKLVEEGVQENATSSIPLNERVLRYETECSKQSPSLTTDHHSVQVAGASETLAFDANESCRRELNSLVLDYVQGKLVMQTRDIKSPRWSVFNVFTQQVATFPSQKDLWHVGPISDSDSLTQYDQKSTFSARSSFWANYVPALNCTKTQPVIPTSLLSSTLANSNASTSLLNLNLLFSCQHGGRTSYEAFKSIVNSIKHHLETRLAQWRMSQMNFLAGQQNHHSLRMANIGQTNSADENIDQQDQVGVDVNKFNTSDSRKTTELIDAHDSGFNKTGRWIELRSKYVGVVLILSVALVSITLASGACALFKRRKQNSTRQGSKSETQIDLDSIAQQIDQANNPMIDTTIGQVENNFSISPLEHSIQALQEPILSDASEIINGHQEMKPGTSTNLVCAEDSANEYIFWPDKQQGVFRYPEGVCKSHSTLNILNESNLKTNFSTLDNRTMSQNDQEPIMMPILTNRGNIFPPHQQYDTSLRRAGCLNNSTSMNGFYGDSSSETQDNPKLSTLKKRVKISDPNETAGNSLARTDYNQMTLRNSQNQIRFNDPQFCPVHQDRLSNPTVRADTAYYINGQDYLPADNELWNQDEFHLLNAGQYVPSTTSKNCDHYIVSNDLPEQLMSYHVDQNYKMTLCDDINQMQSTDPPANEDEHQFIKSTYPCSRHHHRQ